jgi:hypothetical protein
VPAGATTITACENQAEPIKPLLVENAAKGPINATTTAAIKIGLFILAVLTASPPPNTCFEFDAAFKCK